MGNLDKHIENILAFNIRPVVALNRFSSDTDEELAIVKERCKEHGVPASVADVWGKGGEGTTELAEIVSDLADQCKNRYKPTYDWKCLGYSKESGNDRDEYLWSKGRAVFREGERRSGKD